MPKPYFYLDGNGAEHKIVSPNALVSFAIRYRQFAQRVDPLRVTGGYNVSGNMVYVKLAEIAPNAMVEDEWRFVLSGVGGLSSIKLDNEGLDVFAFVVVEYGVPQIASIG